MEVPQGPRGSPSPSPFPSCTPSPLSTSAPSPATSSCCRGWQVRGCPSLQGGVAQGPSPLQGLVLLEGLGALQAPDEDHVCATLWKQLEGHGVLCVHCARKAVSMLFWSFWLDGAGDPEDLEVLVMLFKQELSCCGWPVRVWRQSTAQALQ